MAATLVDMGRHDTSAGKGTDKDADFSAYMSARQPALYRTAYLLAGDHAGAEDLLQNAFAKLYLSWDRIRDREALDGYVRRVMVNENNSLWRRAWKRREHSTDTMPETGTTDTYDDGMGGVLWSFVQTLPPKQRAVVVLRYYEPSERGRDRRGARHLPRHRQVPGQPRPRRAAGPRPPLPQPPRDRRRTMNRTPLEDQVHDALHRRVDPIRHAPLTVTDVRRRARRIQRRRAAVAGVAVAAALAIAVPVGLTMTGSSQRSVVPPATQSPSPSPTPTLVSGTVPVDPRSADVVAETPVPLMDVDGPSLITSSGTIDLPKVYDTLTPYLDGWVGVAVNDSPDLPSSVIEFLDADLRVEDGGSPTGGLVVSPDGTRVAWSEYDGIRWRVVVADPAGEAEWVQTTFPPSDEDEKVIPVGFVSDDAVAVRAMYDIGDTLTFVAGGGQPIEVPGLLQADAASPRSAPSPGSPSSGRKGRASVSWTPPPAGVTPPGPPATTGSARSARPAPMSSGSTRSPMDTALPRSRCSTRRPARS